MKGIDEIHLKWLFYGSRKANLEPRTEAGKAVNRKTTQRLMRLMGLESIAPKPDTSKPSLARVRNVHLATSRVDRPEINPPSRTAKS
jgi:hypothetical protein